MKTKKICGRLLILSLCVLAFVSVLITTTFAAEAVDYTLYLTVVDGEGIAYKGATNVNGYWGGAIGDQISMPAGIYYDRTSNEWCMDGFDFTTSSNYALFFADEDVKLKIIGSNTLTSTYNGESYVYGLKSNGNLTVNGNGTLSVTAGNSVGDYQNYGIYANQLTINGGNINAVSGQSGSKSYGIYASGMTVNTGSVKAVGGTVSSSSSSNSSTLESCGIFVYDNPLTINGGSVNAVGGMVNAGYSGTLESSGIRVRDNSLTINGGTVEAVGGTAKYSYGINSEKSITISNGEVEAFGGQAYSRSSGIYTSSYFTVESGYVTATGTTAQYTSSGISTLSSFIIKGGIVCAEGGEANFSYGIEYIIGTSDTDTAAYITINSGYVRAIGGSAYKSYGIYFPQPMTVGGGMVEAYGGKSGSESCGIRVDSFKITDGTVVASGDSAVNDSGTSLTNSYGMYSYDTAVMENGKLTAVGGDADYSYGIKVFNSSLTINGGILEAICGQYTQKSSGCIDSDGKIVFSETHKIFEPSGGSVTKMNSGYTITANGSTTSASHALIHPATSDCGIWIGDIPVVSANYDDVLGDGSVCFYEGSNPYGYIGDLLVLRNLKIDEYTSHTDEDGNEAVIYIDNAIGVCLIGENTINVSEDNLCGIFTHSGDFVNFYGDGVLDITVSNDSGKAFYAYGSNIFTHENVMFRLSGHYGFYGDVSKNADMGCLNIWENSAVYAYGYQAENGKDGYAVYCPEIYIDENGFLYAEYEFNHQAVYTYDALYIETTASIRGIRNNEGIVNTEWETLDDINTNSENNEGKFRALEIICGEAEVIDRVELRIENFIYPSVGDSVEDYTLVSERGKNYRVAHCKYYCTYRDGKQSEILCDSDEKFVSEDKYSMYIRVIPNEGYRFDENTEILVYDNEGNFAVIDTELTDILTNCIVIRTESVTPGERIYFYNSWTDKGAYFLKGYSLSSAIIPEERSGYAFEGWYTDEKLTVSFDYSEPMLVDTTIYAKWLEGDGNESSPILLSNFANGETLPKNSTYYYKNDTSETYYVYTDSTENDLYFCLTDSAPYADAVRYEWDEDGIASPGDTTKSTWSTGINSRGKNSVIEFFEAYNLYLTVEDGTGKAYVGKFDSKWKAGNEIMMPAGLSYDSAKDEWTMDGFRFAAPCDTAIVFADADVKLNLAGNNIVTNSKVGSGRNIGIEAIGSLTIDGSGSLSVTGGQQGFSFGIFTDTLTISGGTITATGGTSDSQSYGIFAETVTINGGSVTANGGNAKLSSYGIYSSDTITINGGEVEASSGVAGNESYAICASSAITISSTHKISEPAGGRVISWSSQYMIGKGTSFASHVVISPIVNILGDIDGDGIIASSDAQHLARYIAGWNEDIVKENADLDGDGKITPRDSMILTRYLAEWEGYETLPYTGGNTGN